MAHRAWKLAGKSLSWHLLVAWWRCWAHEGVVRRGVADDLAVIM